MELEFFQGGHYQSIIFVSSSPEVIWRAPLAGMERGERDASNGLFDFLIGEEVGAQGYSLESWCSGSVR